MTRKRLKPVPQKHVVLVDTNILWHEDKLHVVSPDFSAFWEKHSTDFPMQLVIPEVVRGELLFQQTTSALKQLDQANECIQRVETITDKSYSHRITEERVIREVEQRFDRWVRSVSADIMPTPIGNIDWPRVIRYSIWRIFPFTPDPKNPMTEKGFRDCMILETVAHACTTFDSSHSIVFVCDDYPLREAAETRLGQIEKFSVYETLKSFESFIVLTNQDRTETFVKLILGRARERFYNPSGGGLVEKNKIVSRIEAEYKDKLQSPSDPHGMLYSLLGTKPMPWEPSGEEKMWVMAPTFERLEGQDTFHWISQVRCVRPFMRKRPAGLGSAPWPTEEERLRVLTINVHWSAKVKIDGRFFNLQVHSLSEAVYTFKEATEQEARRYGLSKDDS